MTDAIISCLSAVASLIAFCAIYVFVMTKPLTYFLLSPSYKKHLPTDTGIGKYKFPEGRGIVYEPDTKYRKYLKKYSIFTYGDRKYIKCQLSENVVSIRYEVAVYNSADKLIKILDLAENIEIKGETKAIQLPNDASYVCLVLKTINEKEYFSTLQYTSLVKICTFSVLTIAMTVACGLLMRTAILSIATLLDFNWYISLVVNIAESSIIGVLVVLLYLAIRKKQIFGEEND